MKKILIENIVEGKEYLLSAADCVLVRCKVVNIDYYTFTLYVDSLKRNVKFYGIDLIENKIKLKPNNFWLKLIYWK